MCELKRNEWGWEWYESLPDGWKPATMDDFHTLRKVHVGMKYLVKWVHEEKWELKVVREDLNAAWLIDFVNDNRVFILK